MGFEHLVDPHVLAYFQAGQNQQHCDQKRCSSRDKRGWKDVLELNDQ